MTNKEIARQFNLLGKLMELHGENPFKFRSYYSAYNILRKWGAELDTLDEHALGNIPGVGKAIVGKIQELVQTGEMQTLNKFKAITPDGIQEMLQIKGLGPKKVELIWKELGIESVGELLYACEENRLIELKGFGEKVQENIRKSTQLFIDSKGFYHFGYVEEIANRFVTILQDLFPLAHIEIVGLLARKMEVLQSIDILINQYLEEEDWVQIESVLDNDTEAEDIRFEGIPVQLFETDDENFGSEQFALSGSQEFLNAFGDVPVASDEEQVFRQKGISFIPAELRESATILANIHSMNIDKLIKDQDIKGVIHNHTTYSDGLNTLREMCDHARSNGYEYIVISDHSKSAFYANGLSEERIYQQWREIEMLNTEYGGSFKVYKGIESDILGSGDLDYEEAVLKGFDIVIASVHSNLKMDIGKSMQRLIRAIENPYTKILGHPTGRLLLSRPGYPVDHKKIIDACAANGVAVELNANPNRLDLDWRWIPYAMEKNVWVAINPDAHVCEGIKDIHFGVCAARKGGLLVSSCLNNLGTEAFDKWLEKK